MKKKRYHFSILLLIPLIVTFFLKSSYATELTIYIWEDYISDKVIDNFTKETGITVKQVHFDSDQTRDEVFASTSGEKFDLVIFDAVSGMIFGKNNLLLGISESMVPNISNIDKRWKESCGNFGVPYFYGTVGVLYDITQNATPPNSWADLLSPSKEHQGHVGMIKDMTDTLIPPLLYLGYNLNSEKEDELKKAYQLLQQQAPYVASYDYVLTAVQEKGDRKKTKNRHNLKKPPRQSTNQKSALAFLNYLSTPEVAADNTEDIYSPTTISAARKLLSDETANDTDLFPEEEELSNAQMYRILSDSNLQLRRRILDTLVKQHEAQ